jgi:hypothetical protein
MREELTQIYGNLCGICNEAETARSSGPDDIRELCIDYCSTIERVQGLLCLACNLMVEHANRDPKLLTAAAVYLRYHQELRISTPDPYAALRERAPMDSQPGVTARTLQLVEWRNDGMTFKEMGRRLGVTRQRATQLWEAARVAVPWVCWCGTAITAATRPGKPTLFCCPGHVPHGSGLLSLTDYDEMAARQDGRCALCLAKDIEHVDHDHESGRVRELLCARCNKLLGAGRDNPHVFDLAVAYVGK